MNDPGLHESINDAGQDIEHNPYKQEGEQEEDEEQDFLDPSYEDTHHHRLSMQRLNYHTVAGGLRLQHAP